MTRASGEILDYLEPRWAVRYVQEVRKQYMAQMRSLEGAVKEAEEQVKAHPETVALRIVLLSLYDEEPETYAGAGKQTAAELIRAWETLDRTEMGLAHRLTVDPFLFLCQVQATEGDWLGVRETSRLGRERNPLRSAEYDEWGSRASEHLEAREGKKTP